MVPAVVVPVDERHVTIVEPGEEVSVISREGDNHDAGKREDGSEYGVETKRRPCLTIHLACPSQQQEKRTLQTCLSWSNTCED